MTIARRDFDFVRALVLKRTGIVLDDRQAYLADSRLVPVADKLVLPDLEALVGRCRDNPDGPESLALVEAMTTNETSFFRDIHPFDALRLHLIPALIRSRQADKKLNIWCAASSTGQEPYSVAMVLHDHFPQLASWKVQIIATDVSSAMIARGRDGLFNQIEIGRGLPAPLMLKHFDRQGTHWRAKDHLRRAIVWRQMNLVTPWTGLPAFDVIFIRNVLIYFTIETRRLILERIAGQMRDDCHVFLGASENVIGVTNKLSSVSVGRVTAFVSSAKP